VEELNSCSVGTSPSTKSKKESMFGHMLQGNMADMRRCALTQIDVISERHKHGPLVLGRVLFASMVAGAYVRFLLTVLIGFGQRRWEVAVAAGLLEARPGGPFSEVSWSYALILSFVYTCLVLLGVRRMEKFRPVSWLLFECMLVYNCTQCLLNLYCCFSLYREAQALGFQTWGNAGDSSSRGHTLGSLIWLQYHCRQLELLGTAFMVLRKRFQTISFLHLYHRVLNLWGWYFACRFACGGDTYFPAMISSLCQMIVYLYLSLSLFGFRTVPFFKKAHILEVQVLQYVLCAIHNVFAAWRGHLPVSLVALHLCIIASGLVLFVDWHHEETRTKTDTASRPRVTFSFDSCGWLMCYHFGVAHWVAQNVLVGVGSGGAGQDSYPAGIGFSGSSGGALVACVLAAGMKPIDVFDFVLAQWEDCRTNPRHMFTAVKKALEHFKYPTAYKYLSGRLRVLLTRVRMQPPFVMAEVVDQFEDTENAVEVLCASCHMPLLASPCPRRLGHCYYYDGMFWPSCLLVNWRGARDDRVVRVSALGAPLSDIRMSAAPIWWIVLPPSKSILRGMFWCGYRDAAAWFSTPPLPPAERWSCRQRLAGDIDGQGRPANEELARWRAARSLVQQQELAPLCTQLPALDPLSKEDVLVLIQKFQTMAAYENNIAYACAVLLLILVVVVVLTIKPINFSL